MSLSKRTLALSVAAVVGVAAVGTYGLVSNAGASQQPAAAPAAMPVDVAPAIARNVTEWDEFSGRLEAVERVEVRPLVGGTIMAVHFKDGSIVKKGDPLFTIDPRPYAAEVARTQAALTAAKSRVAYTTSELERAQKLVADNAIARREFEEKENAAREAQANLQGAAAALDAARLNLEYTRIVAPVTGRVSRAEITAGNVVATGGAAPVLTTLVSVSPMYVAFDADEQTYLRFSANTAQGARTPVYIGLANEDGYTREGAIQSVDNRLDVRSGTIRVRATVDNADGRLTPGLYARVKMSSGAPHDAVLISDKAIGTDQDKKFVLAVDAANKTSYRAVTLGASVDGLRVVKAGLKVGERIVVNGIQRVRPGDPVAPNAVTMESLVAKRTVRPGTPPQPDADAKNTAEAAASAPATAPAAKAEPQAQPANAKTAAAQRLPADRA
ncbi:efflux RND transporter periplasmic adaptor subunit [Ralstonia solanacearum]|uniref:Efflux transporter periplasmic adaptor subunit n=1 Tax=Ralstonia solanacearum TaxID=305 RepID=A0AAD0WIM8_RALSL|nr:efflux RND transporter periplasmic adaptor subunit [Ralstonia solanacearum]AXV84184.1 efflux transporter periplasmic adaptor subunit [Ralstonia solanacearum]AXW55314.1 efflux transporter periplasmic adaptor subunit [Ralstonia solanacearum]